MDEGKQAHWKREWWVLKNSTRFGPKLKRFIICEKWSWCAVTSLPHKVKTQYVHFRLHAHYFILPWKILEEIRQAISSLQYLMAVSTISNIMSIQPFTTRVKLDAWWKYSVMFDICTYRVFTCLAYGLRKNRFHSPLCDGWTSLIDTNHSLVALLLWHAINTDPLQSTCVSRSRLFLLGKGAFIASIKIRDRKDAVEQCRQHWIWFILNLIKKEPALLTQYISFVPP